MSHFFGIDFLVISIPRQISLFLTFGSAYFLHKSASIYTNNIWAKFFAVLLLLTFPVFPYLSAKFGTGAWVMFFSSFAFYLAAKLDNFDKKDLKKIAVVMAIAASVKLSGILIFPLICALIADRLGWKVNKENLKNAAYFLAIFLLCLITFSNPMLLVSMFKPRYFTQYFGIIGFYMNQISTNSGAEVSAMNNFIYGIVGYNSGITGIFDCFCFFVCLILLITKAYLDIKNKVARRFDFIYITILVITVIIYLVIKIKAGEVYVTSYFSAISFLLPLSLIAIFEDLKTHYKKITFVSLLALFITIFIFNHYQAGKNNMFSYSAFYNKSKDPKVIEQLQMQKEMQAIVGSISSYPNKLRIIQDYQAPTIYGAFHDNVAVTYIFDNISNTANVNLAYEFDYILLSKESKAFLSDEDFGKSMNMADEKFAAQNIASRKIVQNLVKTNKFRNLQYELVLNKSGIMLFKKIHNSIN